jgi:hypothetical protein
MFTDESPDGVGAGIESKGGGKGKDEPLKASGSVTQEDDGGQREGNVEDWKQGEDEVTDESGVTPNTACGDEQRSCDACGGE